MRAALVLVAACGAPSPSSVANARPVDTDPHVTRDALVRSAFARAGTGDIAGLIALRPSKAVMDSVVTCTPPHKIDADDPVGLREHFNPHKHGGLTIDVLSITVDPPEPGGSTRFEGDSYSTGCTLTAPMRWEALSAKVRVRRANQPAYETGAWINVYELRGKWYLAALIDKF